MENNQPQTIDIELVPENVEVSFKVNTIIHGRLQAMLFEGLAYKDRQHFESCLEEIKTGNIKDPIAIHMETLLFLIETFEDCARKENLLIKKKFSFPDNKFLDDEPSK